MFLVLLFGLVSSQQYVSAATCPKVANDEPGWSSIMLDQAVDFVAYHKVVSGILHLRLEANATGYLGFGIADPNSGHMKGADMVTASVVDGQVRAEDRHALFAPSTYDPSTGIGYHSLWATEDVHNDWTIVSGEESNGKTKVYVTRPLDTGDSQDRVIISGTMKIIWSRGSSDTVMYHCGNRGPSMVTFFGEPESESFPAYDGVFEQRVANFSILPATTRYVCQSMQFDTLGGDKHVVAIRPIRVKKYHHHALLHICQQNAYWEAHKIPKVCSGDDRNGGQGVSPLGEIDSGCSGQMWVWAAGSGDFVLPSEAGFRIGNGANKISYIVFEIHYDNPNHDTGVVDDFGFQAFYVKTLRQHDAGQITLGDPTVSMHRTLVTPYQSGDLPHNEAKIHRQATCPSQCTKDFTEPVHVFAQFMHMHHFGEKIYSERYASDGSYIGTPNRVDFWDNAFQPVHEKNTFTVSPGETLQTHCFYNTKGKTGGGKIEFGPETGDEMCMDFLFYYPAQYRGIQANGAQVPFAFCGMFVWGQTALTVCGGLAQSVGNAIIPGGQVSKADVNYVDPVTFGTANKNEPGQSKTASACSSAVGQWQARATVVSGAVQSRHLGPPVLAFLAAKLLV